MIFSNKNSMVSSLSSSMPNFHCCMEWKVIQKNIGSFLLWLLLFSAIFLVFTLRSSNPITVTTKQDLRESPTINSDNKSAIQIAESPPPDPVPPPPTTNGSHSQSPPLTNNNNYSVAPIIQGPFPKPSPPPTINKEGLSQNPPPPASSNYTMAPVTQNSSLELPSSPTLADDLEKICDTSKGKWVKEPRGSLYGGMTCPTLPKLRSCERYGKEQSIVFWRWQPEGCELPRFEPQMFLNIVRGKKLAFIGDSLARNQMESLLCLLSQAEIPTEIYQDFEFPTWYFPSHNFTVMAMWTQFFVVGKERFFNGTATGSHDIHLDRINRKWADKLPGVHYAVISGGNWFFRKNYLYKRGEIIGCVDCQESGLKSYGVQFPIRMVLRTALEFISTCKECEGLLVTFLRTYTPSHFEWGSWSTKGTCNRTQPLNEGEISLNGTTWELRNIQLEELERRRIKQGELAGKRRFGLLDITKAMMFRADGHPGLHWEKKRSTASDCLHWCMPGPIDMWNELLLQLLKKERGVTLL